PPGGVARDPDGVRLGLEAYAGNSSVTECQGDLEPIKR
ncbi:MAG: hypothetical protein QOI59_3308, partial [Gammaproteobacteria bacterium]|nr:hypothetical protein [Gammaproteobacteria bacterium]